MPPLEELKQSFPLGDRWRDPKAYEEVVSIRGVEIALAGLSTESTEGEVVTGSAGDVGEIPLPRAYFELLERASVVAVGREPRVEWPVRDLDGQEHGVATSSQLAPASPDPARWRYARSNGVAVSSTWRDACCRASWELIERDRILRSWYGAFAPTRISMAAAAMPRDLDEVYEFEGYSFGEAEDSRVHVVGVFGFPRADSAPLLYGFGARPIRADALSAASRECVQRLGFLWGESIPSAAPDFEPTPHYHQELFLCPSNHPALRAWLRGKHRAVLPKVR